MRLDGRAKCSRPELGRYDDRDALDDCMAEATVVRGSHVEVMRFVQVKPEDFNLQASSVRAELRARHHQY